ncbi:DUF418 domain-containing protein [Paenibacillus senegalensis]|uniref:DUF418 domain-containing protein n=1 Tax=Paenibacillus senegalensis TaxID=1465766 RepID=UPI000287E3DA|nr:DUF418 domain-containing protein [Paenibacillus senegalensis]
MQPLTTNNRIQLLDIARGLAILGILLINMTFFTTSLQAIQFQLELWPGFWDRTVKSLLTFFVSGKFIAVFSFLFGYGMILIKDGVARRNSQNQSKGRFAAIYSRRLFALVLFGLIHGLLIWYGDILLHYALLGFILLLFHKCKPRTLLIWASLLLLLVPGLMMLSGTSGSYELSPEMKSQVLEWVAIEETVYSSGTWGEIQQLRMQNWNSSLLNQIIFYPQILGLFLLGAYFAKKKLFNDLAGNRPKLLRIAVWTGGFGFLTALLPLLLKFTDLSDTGLANQLEIIQYMIGQPLVGVFYIVLLGLLLQRKTWQRVLNPLANVGRMAFTNYLLQSVICTLIFYSYGLGWFGKVGPAAASLLAIAIFALQLVLSSLWFRRFRIGPMEWLWRGITYLSFPPLSATRSAEKSTES